MGQNTLVTGTLVIDFDGTISVRDTQEAVYEVLADPAWREFNRRYLAGELSEVESATAELACLRAGPAEVDRVLESIPLDRGWPVLVGNAQDAGWEVQIASAGFDYFIERVLGRLPRGVKLHCNGIRWDGAKWRLQPIRSPYGDAVGHKREVIESALGRGPVWFVGDGISDLNAAIAGAQAGASVWAKHHLAQELARRRITFRGYSSLNDVARALAVRR